MIINCLVSATYGLGMRSVIQKINFEDFDSVYYNNILATPIILSLSLLLEDWRQGLPNVSNSLWLGILGSGIFAFAIGYSTAWCMRVATSTSYSMVGALNKLPVAFSGIVFFPKERDTINRGSVLSIFVGIISGIVYTFAQIKERQARTQLLPISSNK